MVDLAEPEVAVKGLNGESMLAGQHEQRALLQRLPYDEIHSHLPLLLRPTPFHLAKRLGRALIGTERWALVAAQEAFLTPLLARLAVAGGTAGEGAPPLVPAGPPARLGARRAGPVAGLGARAVLAHHEASFGIGLAGIAEVAGVGAAVAAGEVAFAWLRAFLVLSLQLLLNLLKAYAESGYLHPLLPATPPSMANCSKTFPHVTPPPLAPPCALPLAPARAPSLSPPPVRPPSCPRSLTHWSSPRSFSVFSSPTCAAAICADALISALNVVGFSWAAPLQAAATELFEALLKTLMAAKRRVLDRVVGQGGSVAAATAAGRGVQEHDDGVGA
ncbi:unnamed protein product [Closterium sp. NIES-64]|nr:unnamed protein product [Closterium sp. NIES-64]